MAAAPTTAPATMPATAPTASAPAAIADDEPPLDRSRIQSLLTSLAGDDYAARKAASAELAKLAEMPGMPDLLRQAAASDNDPQVKAMLKELLAGVGQPLLVLEHRVGIMTEAQRLWLFVGGDGRFIYDASSTLFGGKAERSAGGNGDYRQGRLGWRQQVAVRELINASGLARATPAMPGGRDINMAQLAVRHGNQSSIHIWTWDDASLAAGKSADAAFSAAAKLVCDVRDIVKAGAAQPYDGSMLMFVEFNAQSGLRLGAEDRRKLPDWPVGDVALEAAMQKIDGLPLTQGQLQSVRAALEKASLYKFQRIMPVRVWLSPDVRR